MESRLWPIRRSERSYFDPTWDVGHWQDFGRPAYETRMQPMAHQPMAAAPASGAMPVYFEQKMREMESQMDHMFRSFNQLVPSHGHHAIAGSMMPASPTSGALMMPGMSPLAVVPQMEQLKIENPYVTDAQGNRKLQLQFDVRQFKPEEIQVKTENRQLCVHAKHEEKGDGTQVYREYQRFFLLPENLEPDRLSSVLSPEGVLTIEAPMPAIEAPKEKSEVLIPIMHK